VPEAPEAPSESAASTFTSEAMQWTRDTEPAVHGMLDRRVHILIVDDNADMRRYLARLLGKRWSVELASDGYAALASIRKRKPTLVLSDVMMPGLDGFGLLRELRGDPATRSLPVILLSARAGDEAHIEGLEAGADDYVVKPFSARELVARIASRLELHRLGTRLAQERAAIADVFRQTPVPVCILRGQDLVFDDANQAFITAVGVDVRSRPMREALPYLDAQFGDVLREVMRTGVAYVGREVLVPHERSGRLIDMYWTFIFATLRGPSAEDNYVVLIGNDVTEQVVAGHQLAELAAKADAANRTKDEFLAMLGHELRNPLSPIVTSLQLMRLRDLHSSEQDVIERQVNHLRRLVDDLLVVSRIARGKIDLRKERIEIAQVIARAVETTMPLFEQRQHRFELHVPRTGLEVDADPDRLAQVFSNLLTNAAKYSEQGTRISVVAERVDDRVRVRVIDEGVGISADMIEKVFQMFVQQSQTLDRSRGGLGLGLSIVKSLVELHGGSVTVRSDGLGRGSEFAVELDAAALHATDQPQLDLLGSDQGAAKRILVVDDNDDAALTLKKALERLGYAVAIAHDGPAALRAATTFEPDIALLDIGLPVMDGYELAQRLLAQRQIHLVAVTGYGQESDRKRTADAGFAMHLTKPVDLSRLEHVVKDLH
ncbi:MAG: ATP-binding response regulator, partial [Kofleriaceae bacterium]